MPIRIGTSVNTRFATGPIVKYVNGQRGNVPFEFQMVVNDNQFEYWSSLPADGLLTAVGESIVRVIAVLGINIGGSDAETGDKLKEGANSIIDWLRKRKEQ